MKNAFWNRLAVLILLCAVTACGGPSGEGKKGSTQGAIPLRIAISPAAGQAALLRAIDKYGLARKYGFAIEQVSFASPGQQFLLARSDAADVFPGNFLDVQRQRKAGVGIKSFRGFEQYSNQLVAPSGSAIKDFADLRGKRFGLFGTTTVDWLILRAAGKKAYQLDLDRDATVINGAPPLLNQMLARGSVDAAVQFRSVALAPIAAGQLRIFGDIRGLIDKAGFDPDAYYLLWNLSEKWLERHPDPDVLRRLDRMFAEGYAKLATDDAIWVGIAAEVGVKPALVPRFREETRKVENPPYRRDLIAPTQRLLDGIIATTGAAASGVTRIDPDAFLFPAEAGR